MSRHCPRVRAAGAAVLACATASSIASAQPDYHRADLIRTAPTRLVGAPDWVNLFGFGNPSWMEDSTRFWYRVATPRGPEFILVDPTRVARRPLFDNARLAAAMSVAGDTTFDPVKLPIPRFRLVRNESAIVFRVGARRYECELASHRCVAGDTLATDPPDWAVSSPDRRWEAVSRKHDIWIRRADPASRDSLQLTTDGEAEFAYGLGMPESMMPDPDRRRPFLVWAPDSRKIAVVKIDERNVRKYAVYSSTAVAPTLFQYPQAIPSDTVVPSYEIHVLDIERRSNVTVQGVKPIASVFGWSGLDAIQWSPGSNRLYLIDPKRANKGVRLLWADPETGATHPILADSTPTFIENASGVLTGNWLVVSDQDVIWWSERDGWGHFYRYDLSGRVLNQITSGPWLAERIKHVDPVTRQLYFTALGRDSAHPYYAHLMRVGLDGSGLTDLTPESGHHVISVVPTGRHFVDSHTRLDLPPVTSLRLTTDGRKVLDLERADDSGMRALGWTAPRPFTVKARDGVTDLYGLMYLPSSLDTTRKYPVINHVYPGPQVGTILSYGYNTTGEKRGLAELGFVVVQVNALGTPGRSKAFHDSYYGNMGDNGIPDQIAAIKQLAARYPFMDLDRVGVYGHSGGGFASTDAILRHPDFYKVAVSGAGNHDNRTYRFDWGEKYQGRYRRDSVTGRDNFESQANYLLARNLRGRLLLMHGDLDTNVHPAMTLRVVDALIKAGKDFDMLIVPDAPHGLPAYTIRKRWDYFVRWLLGVEPPRDYQMQPCEDPACSF
jgi:dipeptidyl aminopeptidase/acylaminoacyl peptidase